MAKIQIENLWRKKGFKPNDNQREAILHMGGPLFLTAGPGSGKTRVLLWRTVNLLAIHDVRPDEIFLSTFTEKAAKQLRDGLLSLLGLVTNETGVPYDISGMSIGTVHSICQKLISDRRFSEDGSRRHAALLMDELSQYFKIFNKRYWDFLVKAGGFKDADEANGKINEYLDKSQKSYNSRHLAATNLIALFNRFSEESLDPNNVKTKDDILRCLLKMYDFYLKDLANSGPVLTADFSLLQKYACDRINSFHGGSSVFKHIIIDEYQDTNAIQEKIFFSLAKGYKNMCVVGDDDQALYRFRGATVENLVEFEDRCQKTLGTKPRKLDLNINYRSRSRIVDTYKQFIGLTDWSRQDAPAKFYRVNDKDIKAYSSDSGSSVVVSSEESGEDVYAEIAQFVYELKKCSKIQDYSQCAFLFPAMKDNSRVKGFMDAFEKLNESKKLTGTPDEIKIYAPRAGRFLETAEAKAIWGLIMLIFDRCHLGATDNKSWIAFRNIWMGGCKSYANSILKSDPALSKFIDDRKAEIALIKKDHKILKDILDKKGIDDKSPYDESLARLFTTAPGLSDRAKKSLTNKYFMDIVRRRSENGQAPFKAAYVINRATSLDWTMLDLFYQLNGFKHFRGMYDIAQRTKSRDEGPICNLGLITNYLSRFMDEYTTLITASFLEDNKFQNCFFASFTYALYRRGESEYEDSEDPLPKGRISFMTIHQAKGLEFPVVVLGAVFKQNRKPDVKEVIIRRLLGKTGEPLDRISKYDMMRMFYVGLSRAKNLLVLPRYAGRGAQRTEEFKMLFENSMEEIPAFNMKTLPAAKHEEDDIGSSYSYTGDYLAYQQCPRQYMIYRKYGFVPSRTQTMLFGSLVHQTIEDLHQHLITQRKKGGNP